LDGFLIKVTKRPAALAIAARNKRQIGFAANVAMHAIILQQSCK